MAVHQNTLNRTELTWIIMALNQNIAQIKEESHAPELTPLADLAVANREKLVQKLADFRENNVKTITIL